MALKLDSEECKDSQQLLCHTRRQRVQFFAAIEIWLQAVLAWFFQLLLAFFFDLQDAFLAIGFIRRLVAFALTPRCQEAIAASIKQPGQNRAGFNELPYSVSSEARELLIHASLHALINPPCSGDGQLPPIGRILLQTGTDSSGKFQEAVAGALAHDLKASLLVVDDRLLAKLAIDALGNSIKDNGGGSGIWAYILSFWLSGGKVAFVWSVLHRVCSTLGQPLVVLVKDVEKTICSSFESYDAFVDAFGSLQQAPSPTIHLFEACRPQNMVLLGGSELKEKKADSSIAGLRSLLERAAQEGRRSGAAGGPEESFSLLPELGLTIQEEKPEPRTLLDKLFMTRVKLGPPASGPGAQEHLRQMAEDAADVVAERNLQELTSFGLKRELLPPHTAAVLRNRQLSNDEWSKVTLAFHKTKARNWEVVTWAKSMEAVIKTKETLDLVEGFNSNMGAFERFAEPPALPKRAPNGIRRSVSATDSNGKSMDDVAKMLTQLHEARKRKGGAKFSKEAAAAGNSGAGLSERSLWYGIRMLERGGIGLKPSVKTENAYERRLLQEVIRPEDAGSGFADVGALREVKDALREVVQLPLQHPQLFASGSLARLSKGVLLFGPPGTGKTMLARAVAAECGASFLAIHPSAVASKWLGDGVRYVRAAFSLAAKMAPCVIFFDEVDALLSRRNSHHEHEALREMKNEAMAQWDGIRLSGASPKNRVIVLGATNRPQDLDEAVLRRFSRRIFCDVPDRKARQQILEVMLGGESLAKDVELVRVADRTEGYTGSDLREVCTAAAMRPLRDLLKATGKSARQQATVRSEARANRRGDDSASSTPGVFPEDGKLSDARRNGSPSGSCVATQEASSSREGSRGDVSPHALPSGASAEAERRHAADSASERQTEMMSLLLEECDRMADSANAVSESKLRLITAEDFEEAIKQTAPSMDEHSHTMDELRAWNSTYGEGDKNGRYRNPKLTYFI